MAGNLIVLSGVAGGATGDTLQVSLAKANATTTSFLAHAVNFNNPHQLTLAQIGAAPLASPAFTGSPTAPTPATSDNSTALATTAYVMAQGFTAATAGTLTITGDASGSGTSLITLTLASYGAVGTYNSVVTDAKGRVASGSNVAYLTANQPVSISGDASGSGSTAITLTLAAIGTAGTYNLVSTDAKGRVTTGSLVSYLTSNQTITLSGDASGSGTTMLAVSLAATGIGAGTYTQLAVDAKGRAVAGFNPQTTLAASGDATGSASFLVGGVAALALALAPVGSAGTFNQVVTDAKGRVASGTLAPYLLANQGITVSGDATGSGTTAIALTLAASGAVAGTYALASVVVDAKGRVTSASNGTLAETINATGDATGAVMVTGTSGTYALPLSLVATGTPGTYTQVVADAKGRVASGANPSTTTTLTGDVSGSSSSPVGGTASISTTLAAVGTPGTYNQVTTDARGRVTAGASLPYLTANQSITISGDATGSGTTAIALTLAAVGTTGTYTKVVVDAKGRVTSSGTLAVADVSGAAPLASPTFTGTPTGPTPTQFDITTKLATTAYVKNAGLRYNFINGATMTSTLVPAAMGGAFLVYAATSATTQTLPLANSSNAGSTIMVENLTTALVTVVPQGSDALECTLILAPNDRATLFTDGASTWRMVAISNYFNGNQTVQNTLTAGALTSNGALNVAGSGAVTGNFSVANTLTVSGSEQINGNLTVNSTATFNAANVTGGLTVGTAVTPYFQNAIGSIGTNDGLSTLHLTNQSGGDVCIALESSAKYGLKLGINNAGTFTIGGWSDGTSVYRLTLDTGGNATFKGSVSGVNGNFSGSVGISGSINLTGNLQTTNNSVIVGPSTNPIGATTTSCIMSPGALNIYNTASGAAAFGTGKSGAAILALYYGSSGVGSISTNGSSVTYNTTSDSRLKSAPITLHNASNMAATSRLRLAKPSRFYFLADPTQTLIDGFLATDLANAVPNAVTGAPGAVDAAGNPIWQMVDHSVAVPLVAAAVIEGADTVAMLQALVATQGSNITALLSTVASQASQITGLQSSVAKLAGILNVKL